MAAEVLLAGWATKEGSRFKNWKRRFFILRTATPVEMAASGYTHVLLYYTSQKQVILYLGELASLQFPKLTSLWAPPLLAGQDSPWPTARLSHRTGRLLGRSHCEHRTTPTETHARARWVSCHSCDVFFQSVEIC